ncbi:MAG: VWA domain-containing protein [Solidesulfovibrio sp. DCME]|uniref:VWA domain-containing protein n=1 Tax=Solidesulfovibrio sp. DCME TaxID=3447380 RepID=UPI003D152CE6
MIALARPEWLWLLAALPLSLLVRWLGRPAALPVADIGPWRVAGRPGLWARLPMACRLLGLALVACALAGPRLAGESLAYRGRGVDIMLAIDISESMAALDMALGDRTVSRLEAVVDQAARFARSRPGDRIGLVAFASRAYVVLPPSADREALVRALSRLAVGAAGRRTATGDAVALAVKRLDGAVGLAKAVVVLSDGRANAGELRPETAALAAADRGVAVHTVGVGGDGPAPFLVNHPLLGQEIVREDASVDTSALTELARATGGTFWRASDPDGLSRAIDAVGARTPSDMVPVARAEETALAPLALAVAVCLLVAWAELAATRFLRLP